jgi:hypothetical protein
MFNNQVVDVTLYFDSDFFLLQVVESSSVPVLELDQLGDRESLNSDLLQDILALPMVLRLLQVLLALIKRHVAYYILRISKI